MDLSIFYNTNIDWQAIKPLLLLAILITMLILFKRDPLDAEKAIKAGIGIFIISFVLNISGFITISDGFSVFAFVIIALAALRLFWSDTN